MNIAVATGAASNIVVIDLDMREVQGDDVDGEFEFVAWLAARGISLPDTLTASTGGGGKHVILSLPATGVRPVIQSRANWLPGVDIRGDGGYIVVAPSQHVSGHFYQWNSANGVSAITQELISALSQRNKVSAATGKPMPSLGEGESVDVQKLMREGLKPGSRDDGFVRLVGVLRARGDSLETARQIVTEVWQKTEQPENDYYPLGIALEKVDRGYARWEAPEPISDAEMTWAMRVDARAARRHAALGDTLKPLSGGLVPGMDQQHRVTAPQPSSVPEEPLEDDEDLTAEEVDDEDDEFDRDPVQELNIAELMAGGELEREPPTMLTRTDGKCLVYPGRLHSIYGEPGHGKTWVSLYLVKERLEAGESVVYFDYDEDDGGRSMAMRLLTLGLQPSMVNNLHYFNPQGIGRDGSQWERMRRIVSRCKPSLVIVDTMAPALVELGLNETDNTEVGAWYRHARWLLSGTTPRPALVIVDHVVKSGEGRGRWARGAGDKLGRLHAAYAVDSTTPFSRSTPGQINLVIAKDRGGEVGREGENAATIRFTPSNEGSNLQIEVIPPTQASLAEIAQGHTNVVDEARRRILALIQSEPDKSEWRGSDLKRSVNMNASVTNEALEGLVEEGFLNCEKRGRSTHFTRVK
jgi:Bifunctional DNA primase/polymerase, N-terminal/AAA domain